jgi:hypothetical protein
MSLGQASSIEKYKTNVGNLDLRRKESGNQDFQKPVSDFIAHSTYSALASGYCSG